MSKQKMHFLISTRRPQLITGVETALVFYQKSIYLLCLPRMDLMILYLKVQCCTRDEGQVPRGRHKGGGFKPPQAALIKSQGGAR